MARITLDRDIVDAIHVMGRDSGSSPLARPARFWQPVAHPGRLQAIDCSTDPAGNRAITALIHRTLNRRRFQTPVHFTGMPILVRDVVLQRPGLTVGGRWLLTGAAGIRTRNALLRAPEARPEDEARLDAALAAFSAADSDLTLPPIAPMPPLDVPIVIAGRNGFNFFHFLIETLPALAELAPLAQGRRIHLHCPGLPARGFLRGFIDALFPELAESVQIHDQDLTLPQAITLMTGAELYQQAPPCVIPSLGPLARPADPDWMERPSGRIGRTTLLINSHETGLRLLRERAMACIAGIDTRHLPRRIWIDRDIGAGARGRPLRQQDRLLKMLAPIGVRPLALERLSPLEQIAAIARAELVVGCHGAGLAHMIWTRPGTPVIEIGTHQTLTSRWAYFLPLAHVSGCDYITCVADQDGPITKAAPPSGARDLAAPALGGEALQVLTLLVAGLVDTEAPVQPTPERLEAITPVLQDLGRTAQLRHLYEQIPLQTIQRQPALLLQLARLCDRLDDPSGSMIALEALWRRDQSRPRTIERLIWLARRMGDLHRIPQLAAEYRLHQPEASARFFATHPALRRLADAEQQAA